MAASESGTCLRSAADTPHGITLEDYDVMLARQGGVCAICSRPPRDDISLHIDHDHETGRIRGLLCFKCNNFLGDIGDDTELLRRAAAYLATPDPEVDARVRQRVADLKALARR